MKHTYLLNIFILLFAVQADALADMNTDLETLNQHIFIGQAYPSGNIYVRKFTDYADSTTTWPKTINLLPVATNQMRIKKVIFSRPMENKIENNILYSIYIPGEEGMDEDHDSCGIGTIKKTNPNFKKLSGDFFDSMLDHCDGNQGIAIYRTEPSMDSYMILGIDEFFSFSQPKWIKGEKRPMTSNEKALIKQEKEHFKENSKNLECGTNPVFLDSAVQIVEVKINKYNWTLRLSSFDNPGCGGHLSSEYILDILQKNRLLKSFSIYQYKGVL